MNVLMIVTNLGRMKAFRITRDEDDPNASPSFTDLADVDLENLHSRVSERVTDQAGRVSHGPGSHSMGERHNEEQEARQSQLTAIARRINAVTSGEQGKVYLAAPQTIMRNLRDELSGDVRRRIRKELHLDLVKTPKLELLNRFGLN